MNIRYVGSWIPILDYMNIDVKKINAEKDEDIGDGVISKIKIILNYESDLKLKIYDCNDKIPNLILTVENIKITKTGIWFGKIKIYDDLDEKILEALIIRGEKFLKEIFHTHLYHDEDADYLIPPLILVKDDNELDNDKKLRESIINHINNIYKRKFKIYIESITNEELPWKLRRHLLQSSCGELVFYKSFQRLHKNYVDINESEIYESALNSLVLFLDTPFQYRCYIITALGFIVGIAGLFIGIISFII